MTLPRLICFHHAGGASSAFAGWADRLRPWAEVVPVQLPGRERLISEPRRTDMTELTSWLAVELGPLLRPPYACYGHSMGATIAFSLLQRQVAAGRPPPVWLAAGAAAPPHANRVLTEVTELPDAELAEVLIGIGGMSPELRGHPAWVEAAVSLARADLRLNSSYQYADEPPLPCPIHVFTGESDPLVTAADARGWARHTSAGCTLHTVPGGHFFQRESADVLLPELARLLSGVELEA
jgi:surfactin synthase thioesterase subunit